MNISACKRVVLFNLTKDAKDNDIVEMRHYGISAR